MTTSKHSPAQASREWNKLRNRMRAGFMVQFGNTMLDLNLSAVSVRKLLLKPESSSHEQYVEDFVRSVADTTGEDAHTVNDFYAEMLDTITAMEVGTFYVEAGRRDMGEVNWKYLNQSSVFAQALAMYESTAGYPIRHMYYLPAGALHSEHDATVTIFGAPVSQHGSDQDSDEHFAEPESPTVWYRIRAASRAQGIRPADGGSFWMVEDPSTRDTMFVFAQVGNTSEAAQFQSIDHAIREFDHEFGASGTEYEEIEVVDEAGISVSRYNNGSGNWNPV